MPANLIGIAPHFLVADVRQAAEYYRDKLGFEVLPYFGEPPVFGTVRRDGLFIQLAKMAKTRGGSNRTHRPESADAYIWVKDVASLAAEFKAKGAEIVEGPVVRIYGMKELIVRDADGYVVTFGEDVERPHASDHA